MLSIRSTSPDFDRLDLLREFDPMKSTYVVSDLQTKLDIQKILFESHSFLPEIAVLRASELWRNLLLRARPEVQLVSSGLIQSLLSEWLEEQKIAWASGAGAVQNLMKAIQHFIPIFLSKDGSTLFQEWLGQNKNALLRMGQWFFLAQNAWEFFLEKRLLAPMWVPAVLSQSPDLPAWNRHLVLDLDANLTVLEVEIIKNLALSDDITVLAPSEEWRRTYNKVLWPYDILEGKSAQPRSEDDKRFKTPSHDNFVTCRWTTQMTEGKAAVAQVRKWLEEGVPLSRIAVLAPDVEEYWPLLQSYFDKEGIPVAKSRVAALHSYPEVSSWLARLRIDAKGIDSADLELSLYGTHRDPEMNYERFRSLYRHVYGRDDLNREEKIFSMFQATYESSDRLKRDEFVSWSLRNWKLGGAVEHLQTLMGALIQETPPSVEMSLVSWVRYVETLAARSEKTIEPAPTGLSFCNLDSGFYQNWTHVYFLNLSESAVKDVEATFVTLGDVLSIGRDLGFYLDYPESPKLEFLVDWMATAKRRKGVLSFAATQFSGEPQAPSMLWLKSALNKKVDVERFSEPLATRWDEVQGNVSPIADTTTSPLDLKFTPSLSASQIERYLKCPFLMSAEKLLGLVDVAEVDLDLDHRTKGKLQHALLDHLLREPIIWNPSDKEIIETIEKIRREENLSVGDEKLWLAHRSRLVQLSRKFLEFERVWRHRFPATRTLALEYKIEVGLRADTGEFCPKEEGDFVFRGRIDRLDENAAGDVILLDYKASGASLHNYASWIKNNQLQLALYASVIEAGLTELGARRVAGAFYYITKDFEREKGFRLEDAASDFLPPFKKGNRVTPETKARLMEEVKEVLRGVMASIRKGKFSPQPKRADDCEKCRWRKLCRAPHLN